MRAVAREIAACVAISESSGRSAPDSPTPRTEAVWRRGPGASKTPQKLLSGSTPRGQRSVGSRGPMLTCGEAPTSKVVVVAALARVRARRLVVVAALARVRARRLTCGRLLYLYIIFRREEGRYQAHCVRKAVPS